MYLPRFVEGCNWAGLYAGLASCFTLLRKKGIVQEILDFNVGRLEEDVAGHLCDLVYASCMEVVFCKCW